MEKGYQILVKLFVLSILLLLATYAWFTHEQISTVEQLQLTTASVIDIDFSLDNGETWNKTSEIQVDSDFIFKNEITGDGNDLYKATMKDQLGNPYQLTEATKNRDYIEQDIMIRTTAETYIFLADSSYVVPAVGTSSENLIGTNVVRKSINGDFSTDLVAGSIRIAFIPNIYDAENDTHTLGQTTLIWAPNKQYKISTADHKIYTANIDSSDIQSYTYMYKETPTTANTAYLTNVRDTISASQRTKQSGGDPWIIHAYPDENTKITMRIWIEGQDRDCTKAVRGGQFNISLNFVGINKQENLQIPDVTASQNYISGYLKYMEYSTDYGNTWISYNLNANPTFNEDDVVFVRYSETSSMFASDYKVLYF